MINHYLVKRNNKIVAIHRHRPIESLRTITNRAKFARSNARLVNIITK